MKKWITFTLCMMTVSSMTACGPTANTAPTRQETVSSAEVSSAEESSDDPVIGMPNPFIDCSTLEEAADIAGFTIHVPDTVNGYTERTIMAVDQELIQVIYTNHDPLEELTDEELNDLNWEEVDFDSEDLLIRKARGDEDISGDYHQYTETNVAAADGLQVTTKGNDGTVHVAIWTDNGYTFAITAHNAMSSEEMLTLVSLVK